jgi:hypothetical protein
MPSPVSGYNYQEQKRKKAESDAAAAEANKHPGITPGEASTIADIAQGTRDVSTRAQQIADAAGGRRTDPGQVTPSTAAGVNVRGVSNVEDPFVQFAGRTTAPGVGPVPNIAAAQVNTPGSVQGLGQRIAGGTDAAQARSNTAQVQGARDARGFQQEAGDFFRRQLAGQTPSVAQRGLESNLARLSREQLSVAAGARGQSTAAALRNAGTNIGLTGAGLAGQTADLRAKEISDAARGLLESGTATRGQDIDVGKTEAQLGTQVELENAKLRDNAIQAARERLARGEITTAQLETEISKANAEFQQRTSEANQQKNMQVALTNADQEFKASLASDQRLQEVFSERARLKLAADQGDQDAAVRLNGLQAQIDSEINRFNAQQIQTASAQNIENRLKALGLDDAFATAARDLWLRAELGGDAAQIELLKTQIEARIGEAQRSQASRDKWYQRFAGLLSAGTGVAVGIATGNPALGVAAAGATNQGLSSG